AELVGGAVGAVVVPAVLALSWGRFAPAGIITGVALAFLVHVTLAIAAIYTLYWLLERAVSGRQVRRGPPFARCPPPVRRVRAPGCPGPSPPAGGSPLAAPSRPARWQ